MTAGGLFYWIIIYIFDISAGEGLCALPQHLLKFREGQNPSPTLFEVPDDRFAVIAVILRYL